jgi:predicted CoA-binding protein
MGTTTHVPEAFPDLIRRARGFLAGRRIALVGVSHNPKDFSRMLDRELRRRGFDVVPVHPAGGDVDGRPVLSRVADAVPPVEAAILLTPPAQTEGAVRACLDAGVRNIWLHRGGGRGAASPEAIALCRSRGVEPVTDLCPFMAFPDASWGHRLHGWFRRRSLPGEGRPAVP